MKDKVNIQEKFQLFDAYWTPKILGEVNESFVKIFKAKGEFVWHSHENEDEFFLVVKGQLRIKLRDREIVLNPGEFFIVPKGIEHLPYAPDEAHVLLFEPKEVVNTGNTPSDKTVQNPEWI
jgi:quercetin dioxygenase-like cupin family protein